jgi:hypothetical protein
MHATLAIERLNTRLQLVANSLAQRDAALGLLGLGSVGAETERADAFSDLDFFVIVRPGTKPAFLQSLDWLAAAHPIAWSFANTVDGHKALMADGLMCEFAVFEPEELLRARYTPGRWIWLREAEVPLEWASPRIAPPQQSAPDWLLNEALSNLLVGMQRYRRGERLAAMRMVQVYAQDRVLEWIDIHEGAANGVRRDPYNADRRFEFRHPEYVEQIRSWAPGIDGTPQVALALLVWICSVHTPAEALVNEIKRLVALA